jgi:hypothetical protein
VLLDLVAGFFHAPFEIAIASLDLHVESVPVHVSPNYTSDKMF